MDKKSFAKDLYGQGTLGLFVLSLITLGIYLAHYISKQTKKINKELEEEDKISNILINVIFITFYFSPINFIFSLLYPENNLILNIGDFVFYSSWILTITWGFMSRTKINSIFGFQKNNEMWLHGFWTFVFTPYYFNYKMNKIYTNIIINEG